MAVARQLGPIAFVNEEVFSVCSLSHRWVVHHPVGGKIRRVGCAIGRCIRAINGGEDWGFRPLKFASYQVLDRIGMHDANSLVALNSVSQIHARPGIGPRVNRTDKVQIEPVAKLSYMRVVMCQSVPTRTGRRIRAFAQYYASGNKRSAGIIRHRVGDLRAEKPPITKSMAVRRPARDPRSPARGAGFRLSVRARAGAACLPEA